MIALALAYACLLAAPQDKKGDAPLTLTREIGLSVRYRLESEVTAEMAVGLSPVSMSTLLKQESEVTLKAVADSGERTFAIAFGPVSGKLEVPGIGEVKFGPGESTDGLDENLAVMVEMFRRQGNVTVTALVDERGTVKDVEGDEKIFEGLVLTPMMKSLGAQLSDPDLKPAAQQLFARLPDVGLKRSTTFFLEFPHLVGGARVDFRPFGRVAKLSKKLASFEWKTDLAAHEKGRLPAKERDEPLWNCAEPAVKKASIEAQSAVSLADGLAESQTLALVTTVDMPSPAGDGSVLATTSRSKYQLERLPARK